MAQVRLQLSLGCSKTYVLHDVSANDVYGADLANIFQHDAVAAGLTIAGAQSYDPAAASYAPVASSVAASGADCVFLSASVESHAAAVSTAVGAAVARLKIFAADGVAKDAYLRAGKGGIPLSLDPRVYITLAPVAESDYPPASGAFFAAFKKAYGAVQPYAIFGYAAMTLMLRGIDRATSRGRRVADRAKVLAAIFATRNRECVLGTYSIDRNGDTTLRRYGAYRVDRGRLVFLRSFQG